MNLLRRSFPHETLSKEIELGILVSFLLFFPDKSGLLYFLSISGLLVGFSVKSLLFNRNIGLSTFTYALIAVNCAFILTATFSYDRFASLLEIADFFIISAYFFLFFNEYLNTDRFYSLILHLISVFSVLNLVNVFFFNSQLSTILFDNPIRIAVISGLGVLIALFELLKRRVILYLAWIILNLASLYMAESKGAFIGIILLATLMLYQRYRKMITVVLILLLLTLVFPNPIRNMFTFSLYKDKYATGRLDIWNMNIRMFLDHPVLGIGPNNFKDLAPRYNFRQRQGPANYFKVPRQSHNDYLKLISENGLVGVAILFLLLYSLIRMFWFRGKRPFDLPELLVLYLMFEMLFFNLLFRPFFLFIFLLLLKLIFEKKMRFINLSANLKLVYIFSLLFVFMSGHILPFLSELYLKKASSPSLDDTQRERYLDRSSFLMPLSAMPQYAGGLLYFNRFTRDFDFDHCYVALDHLKRAERLAPFNPDIKQALLQVYLYYYKPIIQIGMQKRQTRDKALADLLLVQNTFPALNPEIIGRLHRLKREIAAIDAILKELLILFKNAGRVDPFNPFLKYREAVLLLEFGRREEALAALKQAVAIESDFLDALLMLQEEFKYFGVGTDFKRHVLRIERMGQSKHIRKGSYLFRLYHRSDFSLYRLRLPSALDSNV